MARYYAAGYSRNFTSYQFDGTTRLKSEEEEIVFIEKDADIACDLHQWAYSQQPTSENALEVARFCYWVAHESLFNKNSEAEAKWGKEVEEWFETAFFIAANKFDACMQIIAVFPFNNWSELSTNKVAACLAIGERYANGVIESTKDTYSKPWDERAYTHVASQAEKDRVCEAIATRYSQKG